MESKRYTIVFFGINTNFYTVDFVSYIWNKCAEKEFEKSGIYVTALIDSRSLVCGKRKGCSLGDEAHVISTAKDPRDPHSEEEFFSALKEVILEVRQELGHPAMTLERQKVEFTYFFKLL